MNKHCSVCNSAFGVLPDYSEPNFIFKSINGDIISRVYKCQDCGATFTFDSQKNNWKYNNDSNFKGIIIK